MYADQCGERPISKSHATHNAQRVVDPSPQASYEYYLLYCDCEPCAVIWKLFVYWKHGSVIVGLDIPAAWEDTE